MLLGLKDRIKHLTIQAQKAIVSEVLDVLPGTEFVSDATQAGRLTMCESCPNMNKENRKCKLCGCFIDQKTRVLKLPFTGAEHCPENKW
jgi:hypothetical protein